MVSGRSKFRRLRRGRLRTVLAALSALMLSPAALATAFPLPPGDESVVGEVQIVAAREGETLLDIARRYKIGYQEIRLANPGVDTWLPGAGTEVVVPTQFVLPDAPRRGIVVNVPEMRLYYFPEPQPGERGRVFTYPISVGRGDWETPTASTRIVNKDKDPAWIPPESIRAEHAAEGDPLPKVVPPGPENPLGRYALRLGLPGYLIHGTNRPYGIGMKVTHGCLRLYPEDINALYHAVSVDTPVRIVSQPAKAGWLDGRVYIEVHPSFDEKSRLKPTSLTPLVRTLMDGSRAPSTPDTVQWPAVYAAARVANGIPSAVSEAPSPTAGTAGRPPAPAAPADGHEPATSSSLF